MFPSHDRGGSGIAALAQTLSNQGQLNLQKASASIGMQEAANQKLAAGQAAKNQALEGKGELIAQKAKVAGAEAGRGLEYQKTSTLFGMSQQRAAAADAARRQAMQDQMSAVGDIASAGADMALNIAGAKGLQPKLGGTGGGGTNTPVFQSGVYGPNPEYDTDGDGVPNFLDPDTQ